METSVTYAVNVSRTIATAMLILKIFCLLAGCFDCDFFAVVITLLISQQLLAPLAPAQEGMRGFGDILGGELVFDG